MLSNVKRSKSEKSGTDKASTSKATMAVEELAIEEPPEQGYIPKRNRSLKRSSRIVDSVENSEKDQPPASARSLEPEHKRRRHSRRQLVEDTENNEE